MTSLIIDFMLDAFALGAPELEATVEVLLAKPVWYWKHLGRPTSSGQQRTRNE